MENAAGAALHYFPHLQFSGASWAEGRVRSNDWRQPGVVPFPSLISAGRARLLWLIMKSRGRYVVVEWLGDYYL